MTAIIVPAREGCAAVVPAGARIRVTTPKGHQAADFFAFNGANIREWLSPPHSWVTTFSVKPRLGDVLISRFRRPMVKLVADVAAGCHDMMIAACDQFRYEFFGHQGP
ncbi:MAG TPA: urea carboxylase-associated family protein, partial [Dongiaceae bacterium]